MQTFHGIGWDESCHSAEAARLHCSGGAIVENTIVLTTSDDNRLPVPDNTQLCHCQQEATDCGPSTTVNPRYPNLDYPNPRLSGLRNLLCRYVTRGLRNY